MPGISDHTAIIILAAGSSSRLGQPKQLLNYRGKTLLQHVIDEALAANTGPVLVVLGAGAEDIRPFCGNTIVVVNDHWQEGMASSIRLGVQALQAGFTGISGCIIAVCDQPFIHSGIFQQLVHTHQQSNTPIVAVAYDQTTRGTPVYFHQHFFPHLLSLRGDKGARSLLQIHQQEVSTIPFQEGKIDIDTGKDVEWLNRE